MNYKSSRKFEFSRQISEKKAEAIVDAFDDELNNDAFNSRS
jgi:ABC-type uncharacterized transport system auxiliary subunit